MNSEKPWGHRDRWFISKLSDRWYIYAPGMWWANWSFPTGAAALAAFAEGDPNV